jgi:hypothetical protein
MRYNLILLMLLAALGGCSTPGAFFGDLDGPVFQPHRLSDEDHALVYLYRPRSEWADQELEAPGLFLNNQLIGSLPSNGHLVMELEVASYQVEMRRPLFGSYWTLLAESPLDFTRVCSFALDAEAGGIYYLRFDELGPPPENGGGAAEGDGPLRLVSQALAERELGVTREVQPLERIAASGEPVRRQRGFWRAVGRALDRIGI